MSIIYDALQKTQQHREATSDTSLSVNPKRRIFWKVASMIFACLIILSIFSYVVYFLINQHFYAPVQPVTKTFSFISTDSKTNGNLVLNGVFLSDQSNAAVFNNHIFHVGDTVDGKKIIRIQESGVEMR